MTTQWNPQINPTLCTGCGRCMAACPTGALDWQSGKAALLRAEQCSYCADCETICPVNAIELPYLIVKNQSHDTQIHQP